MSKKKTCQNCQHFTLKNECEIVKKRKNLLLTGCYFYRDRANFNNWKGDKNEYKNK